MIPFLDLQKINEIHQKAFQNKLDLILQKGWFVLGDEVALFEKNYATYCDSAHCIGVGNGLDALVLIFKAYIKLGKLQKGDQVIVPANTYIASILAIIAADLIPVLVEPERNSFNIDPNLIEAKITNQSKAILVVHLYGQLADMEHILRIAKRHNLIVVDDAAQSHGARFQPNSTIQDIDYQANASAHSFYPSKNLGALGDGGAITTNDDLLAKTLKMLRNYGSETKYLNQIIGTNSRLDEIQAAFLNVKLPYLDAENKVRQQIAKRYLTAIKNPKIELPYWDFSGNHVFHLFVIRTQNRNKLQAFLTQNGIQTVIHYPIAPQHQQALKNWNFGSFPITDSIHDQVLSLPMHHLLTAENVDKIIQIVNQY